MSDVESVSRRERSGSSYKGSATEFADVAQLVEHSLGKGEVISSILIIGSRIWEWEGRE